MILRYQSVLEDQNPETVFGWHCRTGALERLIPPWAIVDLLDRKGGIDNEGEVALWGECYDSDESDSDECESELECESS